MARAKGATDWFSVDKEGLRELYANFPLHRLIVEAVQNAWDEATTLCTVDIGLDGRVARLVVTDDNPEGFRNIRDAYTLFGHTAKRSDPTKRGRYNLGEKLLLARASAAQIITTKGGVSFDAAGRHELTEHRERGSQITALFPKCSQKDLDTAVTFLALLYPPQGISYVVNGQDCPYVAPYKRSRCQLSTEILVTGDDGCQTMRRSNRMTDVFFYRRRDRADSAQLYEMGIPVCEIEGCFDVDVQQKIPLDKDRTMVPQPYLQDIYAELANALTDEIPVEELSRSSMRAAMEDGRTDPETAAKLFKRTFGDTAVLQSHDPDSDQEAARQNVPIVSSRTFGADVNGKLRQGGISTAKEQFCRDVGVLTASGLPMPGGFRELKEDTAARKRFAGYVRMLNAQFYGGGVDVKFGTWMNSTAALYSKAGAHATVTFNVMRLGNDTIMHPVSKGTGIILHELSHAKGDGHDGVYDRDAERLVNGHTALLAKEPARYVEFEPGLFESRSARGVDRNEPELFRG